MSDRLTPESGFTHASCFYFPANLPEQVCIVDVESAQCRPKIIKKPVTFDCIPRISELSSVLSSCRAETESGLTQNRPSTIPLATFSDRCQGYLTRISVQTDPGTDPDSEAAARQTRTFDFR